MKLILGLVAAVMARLVFFVSIHSSNHDTVWVMAAAGSGASGGGMGRRGGVNRKYHRRHYHYHSEEDTSQQPTSRSHSLSHSLLKPTPYGTAIVSEDFFRKRQQRTRELSVFPRGGSKPNFSFSQPSPSSAFVRIVGTIVQVLVSAGKIVLPTIGGAILGVIQFYRALPIDAITAQIGLVYCFLGGYYPTLFSSLQAARYCGLRIMVDALADLTDEATKVVDEIEATDFWDDELTGRELFLRKTNIVLKTVDPVKINEATGALYTTWLGVSTVLQREYARTISLSLTLAEGLERAAEVVLVPALNVLTPNDYRKWVPAVIGWTAKAAAMNVAWRIERVLTASTSAIAGGAMFARSVRNMFRKHREERRRLRAKEKGEKEEDDDSDDEQQQDNPSIVENVLGFAVGGLGFFTQMECQFRNKFSFEVAFPFSLMTWPFDLAERWIQWYITKY